VGALQAGLRTPTALYSPSYGTPDKTKAHRTHESIQGLAVLGRARHSARSRSAHRTGVLLKTYRSMRNGFAGKDQEGVRRSGRMDKGATSCRRCCRRSAGRAVKVLIVDDSAIHRERLAANLAKEWAGSAIGADTFTVNG
jgi:hypothetical protein